MADKSILVRYIGNEKVRMAGALSKEVVGTGDEGHKKAGLQRLEKSLTSAPSTGDTSERH